jgi:hypothetical protein
MIRLLKSIKNFSQKILNIQTKKIFANNIKTKIIVNLLGVKFSFSVFPLTKKQYFLSKKRKYNIIPVGQNCFPRVLVTSYELKTTRAHGEKTCVFDLCNFNSIPKINVLIKNHFENFFDDMKWNEQLNAFESNNFECFFVHDKLPYKNFVKRYKSRIENFYDYTNDERLAVYILSVAFDTEIAEIIKLRDILKELRKNKKFYLFVINCTEQKMELEADNIILINANNIIQNLQEPNKDWVKEVKELTPIGQEWCNPIIQKINLIIQNNI